MTKIEFKEVAYKANNTSKMNSGFIRYLNSSKKFSRIKYETMPAGSKPCLRQVNLKFEILNLKLET